MTMSPMRLRAGRVLSVKFVETGDPDIMQTRRGGGLPSLFGLPFLLTGLLVIGVSLEDEVAPWYVTLSFGAVFLLLGAVLCFGRSGLIIDRRRGTLVRWSGLLVPMKKSTQLLAYYDRITLRSELRRGEHRMYRAYPILLAGTRGAPEAILFTDPADYAHARKTAERISRFLQLPLVDTTSGQEVIRDPDELDDSVRDRAKRNADGFAVAAPPPGMRARIREDAGNLVVDIPRRKLGFEHARAMAVLVLIGAAAAFLALGVGDSRDFEGSDLILHAPIALAIPLFAIRAVLRQTRKSARITVSREMLEVEKCDSRGRRVTRIPVDELETFAVGNPDRQCEAPDGPGGRSDAQVVAGRRLLANLYLIEIGPSITASSDEGTVSFGRGLGEEELLHLHALIEKKLATP